MKCRVVSLLLFAAAMLVLVGAPLTAQDAKNTHTGKLVNVKGSDFTMEAKGKQHMHTLAADGKVLGLDGKECKLQDLVKGQRIRVTTKEGDIRTATKVEAIKKTQGQQ
jgi:hypothetical protein